MKFLLLALAVFGVAQANLIQLKLVNEALNKIKAAIPSDKIFEILQACSGDPEVQAVQDYFIDELTAIVLKIHDNAEIQAIFPDLQIGGVVFEWLNHLFELCGIELIARDGDTFTPKNCGGWRGVVEKIQGKVNFTDIVIVKNQVIDAYSEFAAVWHRIEAALPVIVHLLRDPANAVVFGSFEDGLDFVAELFYMMCNIFAFQNC